MKLFNKNKLNTSKLLTFIHQKKMDKYLIKKENLIDVYSKNGIYLVDDNNTYKIKIKNEEVEDLVINNTEYWLDKTIIEKKIVSQLPNEHLSVPLIKLIYSINDKSECKLVVECVINNHSLEPNYDNLTPINYYFEINSFLKNDILNYMQDSNVFLSMLN
jgi:hypothetical protein